jgi:UDP-N-acetylmuramoyl-L-alanine---L-glutamate ligase
MRPPPSRHHVSWADLAGAPVGVWGLGVEGQANLRKLAQLGVTDPVLVDDRPPDDQRDRVLATGEGGLDALAGCAYVVKTPGIPRYRPEVAELEAAGVPVLGGLGLWLEEADRDRVVCVTGSKGKSTTVSVLGHLLEGFGRRAFVGGNLGLPPYDPEAPSDPDLWVVEVSSYQATDVASSPAVVGVTSLSPDHLNWHGDVATYYRDKLSLCAQDGARVTVANGDDAELRARAEALGPEVDWVVLPDEVPPWIAELGLLGRHNHRNALLAQRCLVALGVDGAENAAHLTRAARGFAGLDSRLQVVGVVDGVEFVDDSLSTNVLPTVAAIDVFDGRAVALLAGGFDRDIDYGPLAHHLATRRDPTLLVALPSSGARILAALDAAEVTGPLDVVEVPAAGAGRDWLPGAVRRAFDWARPRSGVVLLSPAAASFDHFADYADRAAVFTDAMRACEG